MNGATYSLSHLFGGQSRTDIAASRLSRGVLNSGSFCSSRRPLLSHFVTEFGCLSIIAAMSQTRSPYRPTARVANSIRLLVRSEFLSRDVRSTRGAAAHFFKPGRKLAKLEFHPLLDQRSAVEGLHAGSRRTPSLRNRHQIRIRRGQRGSRRGRSHTEGNGGDVSA